MPNKFITNLDLMQLGIPFSGFPTGVDTSTITSLGVVDIQFAALSGNTGTTVFNVTDPASPYYTPTGNTLSTFPYTQLDQNTLVETDTGTTYSTIMTFTALSGTSDAPLSISFSPPIIQELYDRGAYGTLFNGLGLASIGTTFIDESFYNVGSIFSGANLNMEIVEYAPHGTTPAWVTGTTSGTVIEYSGLTKYWTDPTIIAYTSGLTLPITPESAETQTSDYIWTLTDSTIIDENVVGTKYTGYSITYSFGAVVPNTSGGTDYIGTVTATFENFSAGTLDYKGSTNWISIDGNATVTERLTVDRLTINNPGTGTPINNIGITSDGDVVFGTTGATVTGLTFNDFTYDLTVGLDNGDNFTDNLGILASDIKVTGGTYDGGTGEMTFVNNSGGSFVVSGLTTEFTGNTSGNCITDLHITNLHSCSPLYVNPLDEGNVYFGSTSGVTIDVANNRIGIGTETPSSQLHIAGSGASTTLKIQSEDTNNAVITIDSQTTGGSGFRNTAIQFQENSTTQWMIGMNGIAGGSEEDKQFVIANNTSFDTDNVVNINPSNGYVGIGVQAPTEILDVGGNIKVSGELNLSTLGTGTSVNNLGIDISGNVVSAISATVFWKYGTDGTESLLPNYTGTTSDAKGDYSGVFGGQNNVVETGSTSSSIIGGNDNTIDDSFYSTIIGGSGNTLTWAFPIFASSTGGRNAIISSEGSFLSGNTSNTVILGGQNNNVYDPNGSILTQGENSAIIGGDNNVLTVVDGCVIVGGEFNVMSGANHNSCAIVGGVGNELLDTGINRSVIIGGQNITAYSDDTVYTTDLIVSGDSIVSNNSTVNNDLLVNGDADFAGGILQTGVNLYGSSTAAINLTNKSIVRFELDGTLTGSTIGSGSTGQRVILYVEVVTNPGTTEISVPDGLGFTQIVFSSLADSVEMIYDSSNWLILSSRGATIT
jgi:hypothetical protein